jgi:4-hydroxybenzoate polyprenyltransferase
MKNSSKHETLRGWFQLVRLPHLFTVPGDPLIGFLIAGGMMHSERGFFPIAAVCFISFAMSLFGIITNDLADIQLDMTQHPDRPLPRGAVSPRAASYAAQLCFLAAVVPALCLGWRFTFITLVALVSIYTYNFYVKYRPKRMSMMMAVMRDLMFGLGILIVPDISIRRILLLVLYGVGLFLYYCGLNEITRAETLSKIVRPGGGKMLAGACCCAIVPLVFVIKLLRDSTALLPVIFGLFAILLCAVYLLITLWVYQVSRTGASPARVQMSVLVSFRAAFLVQAAATAACGLVALPAILLLCLGCSALAKKYSCS